MKSSVVLSAATLLSLLSLDANAQGTQTKEAVNSDPQQTNENPYTSSVQSNDQGGYNGVATTDPPVHVGDHYTHDAATYR